MRHLNRPGGPQAPRFFSVGQVAGMLGCSTMTIYREIQLGQFPAVKVRSRYLVPAKAIDDMENAALEGQTVVDAADFVLAEGVA